MYTKIQNVKIYALILVVAAVAMMASCNGPARADGFGAAPQPYSQPYQPLGSCNVGYDLAADETSLLSCAFDLPPGVAPDRASILATVGSGTQQVQSWTVFAGEFGPGPFATIYVNFAVHNTGTQPVSAVAQVTVAITQTTTPAVGAAGVE